MRYSQTEKMETIRVVEESALSVKRTLEELDISKSTLYNWYRRYLFGRRLWVEPIARPGRVISRASMKLDTSFNVVSCRSRKTSFTKTVRGSGLAACVRRLKIVLSLVSITFLLFQSIRPGYESGPRPPVMVSRNAPGQPPCCPMISSISAIRRRVSARAATIFR